MRPLTAPPGAAGALLVFLGMLAAVLPAVTAFELPVYLGALLVVGALLSVYIATLFSSRRAALPMLLLLAAAWAFVFLRWRQMLLLGAEVDLETLVAYEYVPLITESYQETYGDAIAPFTFATPYQPGQTVVSLLGLPRADAAETDPTLMDWAVQRAEVNEQGEVEIVFDQLALIGMGEQTALMLVLSEPMPETAAQ